MRLTAIVISIILISAAGPPAHSAVPDSLFLDDSYSLPRRASSASLTYDDREKVCLDCFTVKLANFADSDYNMPDTRTHLPIYPRNKNRDPVYGLSRNNHHYDKVVSWIKDAFQEWNAKDQDEYPRLILLSFGIIGVIGIRRTVKKRLTVQDIGRRNVDIADFKTIA
jgi:hypothetical protein